MNIAAPLQGQCAKSTGSGFSIEDGGKREMVAGGKMEIPFVIKSKDVFTMVQLNEGLESSFEL